MRRYELKNKIKFFLKQNEYEQRNYILFCDGSGPKPQNKSNRGKSAYVLYDYDNDKIISSRTLDFTGNSFQCEMNALYHGIKFTRFVDENIYIFIDNLSLFNSLMNKDYVKFKLLDLAKIKEIENMLNNNNNISLVSVNRQFVEVADLLMRETKH